MSRRYLSVLIAVFFVLSVSDAAFAKFGAYRGKKTGVSSPRANKMSNRNEVMEKNEYAEKTAVQTQEQQESGKEMLEEIKKEKNRVMQQNELEYSDAEDAEGETEQIREREREREELAGEIAAGEQEPEPVQAQEMEQMKSDDAAYMDLNGDGEIDPKERHAQWQKMQAGQAANSAAE